MRWLAADMAAAATAAAVATAAAAAAVTVAARATARLRGAKVRAPLALRPRKPTPASQFLRPLCMAARSWFVPATQCRPAHGAYRLEPLSSVAGIRIVSMRRPPPSRGFNSRRCGPVFSSVASVRSRSLRGRQRRRSRCRLPSGSGRQNTSGRARRGGCRIPRGYRLRRPDG